MAIPSHMWLKDDGGALIKGSSDVANREGSIEIIGFGHGLHIPTDNNTGKITGTRIHAPIIIEKEFDSSSPLPLQSRCFGSDATKRRNQMVQN